jgi:predicted DCC family thiol-disulfide oxidoreductase YuxK
MTDARAIVLYDGTCGFCAASIRHILAHEEAPGRLLFAPLGGRFAKTLGTAIPSSLEVDSILFVTMRDSGPPEVVTESDAIISISAYMRPGWRALGQLARVVPSPVRDWGYHLIARNRHRLGPRQCLLPTPLQRARFLD